MKRLIPLLLSVFVLYALPSAAFERQHSFAFKSGGRLRITMKAGDLLVRGTLGEEIRVKLVADDSRYSRDELERKFKVNYSEGRSESRLEVTGVKTGSVQIFVPARTDLSVTLFAGQMVLEGVAGDLTTRMFAGETDVKIDPALYRSVRTHVGVGDLEHPFRGESSGWLGKNFNSTNLNSAGNYRLDLSVRVGQLSILRASHLAESRLVPSHPREPRE